MSFARLLAIVAGRKWLALAIFCAVTAAAIGWTLRQPTLYFAEAAILVDVGRPDPISGVTLSSDRVLGHMRTQFDLVRSRAVARAAVERLGLASSAAVRGQWLAATGGKGSVEDWLADAIIGGLGTWPARGSSVFKLSYTAPSPRLAASVANAVAEAYVERAAALRADTSARATDWLDAQRDAHRAALAASERALAAEQARRDITSLDERVDAELRRLARLEGERNQARLVRESRDTRAAFARSFVGRGIALDTLPDVLAAASVRGALEAVAAADRELAGLVDRFGPAHPTRRAAEERRALLQARADLEIAAAAAALAVEADRAGATERAIDAALAAQRARVLAAQADRATLATLAVESAGDAQALAETDRRLQLARLEARMTQGPAVVLAAAVEPSKPVSRKLRRNALIGAALGLLLALAAVLQIEIMRQRVRDPRSLAIVAGDGAVLGMPRARLVSR